MQFTCVSQLLFVYINQGLVSLALYQLWFSTHDADLLTMLPLCVTSLFARYILQRSLNLLELLVLKSDRNLAPFVVMLDDLK